MSGRTPSLVFLLAVWVDLLLEDFNLDSYTRCMRAHGQNPSGVTTLGRFAWVGLCNGHGTPTPAMRLRDSFRMGK